MAALCARPHSFRRDTTLHWQGQTSPLHTSQLNKHVRIVELSPVLWSYLYRLQVPPLSGIQSIFCHADIAGASMNGNTLSLRGLSPQIFPKSLPTFSGHFHKPHSLRGGTITYVGSPYQTTLSEAGQSKRLLLLQGGQRVEWSEEDNIGLDIGKR